MVFQSVSSPKFLIFCGKAVYIIKPWQIIIDTDLEVITIRQREPNLINVKEDIMSFRFIRKISIKKHLIGADIHIDFNQGGDSANCLPLNDVVQIKNILLAYNRGRGTNPIIFA